MPDAGVVNMDGLFNDDVVTIVAVADGVLTGVRSKDKL